PHSTLCEAYRILKPDGEMQICLPVVDTLPARIFKRNCPGWDVPRHLTMYSRRTLNLLLDKSKFKVLKTKYHYGTNDLLKSIIYYLEDKGFFMCNFETIQYLISLNRIRKVRSLTDVFVYLIHLILLRPICFILAKINQGDSCNIVCKKSV
ncbi:class I SAM-dependent methyltransferase, partial [bacterium]|nr:class I SAM-dependent methyltransferase [bacterium]